ncbi:MAG: lasso peptide biosynthesis protein [Polyangiaceae bacterium]
MPSPGRVKDVTFLVARRFFRPSTLPGATKVLVHGIHAVAWAALRTTTPTAAMRAVVRVSRVAPRFDDARVEAAFAELEGIGTCLSQCLAVAPFVDDVAIVIGVTPLSGTDLDAHAWLERGGAVVPGTVRRGGVLARIPWVRDPG